MVSPVSHLTRACASCLSGTQNGLWLPICCILTSIAGKIRCPICDLPQHPHQMVHKRGALLRSVELAWRHRRARQTSPKEPRPNCCPRRQCPLPVGLDTSSPGCHDPLRASSVPSVSCPVSPTAVSSAGSSSMAASLDTSSLSAGSRAGRAGRKAASSGGRSRFCSCMQMSCLPSLEAASQSFQPH